MSNKMSYMKNRFAYFLLLFIALQPVLDLLTSLFIQVLHMSATVGIVVRLGVMLLALGYVFLHRKEPYMKKWVMYTFILGATLTAGLVNNLLIKQPISIGAEIKFIAKCIYPVIMLFAYILVFKMLKDKQYTYHKTLLYFLYASLFIGIVMFISIVTNTDFQSYDYSKIGSSGWFYAANELSAILAIIFPIVVLYANHKTTSFKKAYYWIPVVLAIYASIVVGTKVGYGAVILTLGVAVFFSFVEYIMKRKTEGRGHVQLLNGLISVVMLGGLIVITPFTPIAKNIGIHLDIYQAREEATDTPDKPQKNKKPKEETDDKLTSDEVNSLIYSDRDKFLAMHKQYFNEAPTSQKLLGMGYASNYEKTPKMVEMDFHDLFFSFGIIGSIVYLFPFVYFGIRLLIRVFMNFKTIWTVKYMMLASTLALALGIAFTAGHVLTAPAVSIFFVVILAYLVVDLQAE